MGHAAGCRRSGWVVLQLELELPWDLQYCAVVHSWWYAVVG